MNEVTLSEVMRVILASARAADTHLGWRHRDDSLIRHLAAAVDQLLHEHPTDERELSDSERHRLGMRLTYIVQLTALIAHDHHLTDELARRLQDPTLTGRRS